MMTEIPVIIPARSASTRFPRKPLAPIFGKPMIIWVCELSAQAVGKELVWVATDSPEIASVCQDFGFQAVLTSETCPTGTDRVAEAMRSLSTPIAINVQGDEPILDPQLIRKVAVKLTESQGSIINGASLISDVSELSMTSVPKVVFSETGRLLYASRAMLPGTKTGSISVKTPAYKQVCVYGLRLDLLSDFGQDAEKTELEAAEDIEILRFLENDIPVEIVITDSKSIAVDYPDDIVRVENMVRSLDES